MKSPFRMCVNFRAVLSGFDQVDDGVLFVADFGQRSIDLLFNALGIQSAGTDELSDSFLGLTVLMGGYREHDDGFAVDVLIPCAEAKEFGIHTAGCIYRDGKHMGAFLTGALIQLQRLGAIALDLGNFIVAVIGSDTDLIADKLPPC